MSKEQVGFISTFERLWHEAGYSEYDSNKLCGYYHQPNERKIEIVWLPEHPTTKEEADARQVFKAALSAHDSFDDGRVIYFSEAVPTMGHTALILFSDADATIRELQKVANIRELGEASKILPTKPQNLIG